MKNSRISTISASEGCLIVEARWHMTVLDPEFSSEALPRILPHNYRLEITLQDGTLRIEHPSFVGIEVKVGDSQRPPPERL